MARAWAHVNRGMPVGYSDGSISFLRIEQKFIDAMESISMIAVPGAIGINGGTGTYTTLHEADRFTACFFEFLAGRNEPMNRYYPSLMSP